MKKKSISKDEIVILAEQVKLLFQFVAKLIPHIETIEKTMLQSAEQENHIESAAAIYGAMGQDWESMAFEANLRNKRAKALLNLIKVLKETEDERVQRKAQSKENQQAFNKIMGIIG